MKIHFYVLDGGKPQHLFDLTLTGVPRVGDTIKMIGAGTKFYKVVRVEWVVQAIGQKETEWNILLEETKSSDMD